MKRLTILAAMMFLAVLSGEAKQAKPENKTAPAVTGRWIMTLDMSMGTANPGLDLKQEEGKITGSYTGRYGTFPLEGTIKERAFEFSFTMTAEGEEVPMTFTGEISADGATLKGRATLGPLGDATWSAVREKGKTGGVPY